MPRRRIAMAERCGETLHVHIEKALYGNFEFDLDDGEVVFKYSSIVPEGADLDYDYFDHIVLLSLAMLDKYADGLIAMMLGYSDDPEGAYKKCMENDD